MNFLHTRVSVPPGSVIRVDLEGTEANVMAMDDIAFNSYRRGRRFPYFGGHFTRSPAVIQVAAGDWNVVVDMGGGAGRVTAAVNVVRG